MLLGSPRYGREQTHPAEHVDGSPADLSEEAKDVSQISGQPLSFSLAMLEDFDVSKIVSEPVEPIDSEFSRFGGRCLALRNVLTQEECSYLIQEMSTGGEVNPVTYRQDYRRNDRCTFESRELASLLWQRVRPVAQELALFVDAEDPSRQRLQTFEPGICPEELRVGYGCEGLWVPVGLNECVRFCRYNPGGFFRAHCDGRFRRSDDEMSFFTCMFYLDGVMDGGATRFLKIDAELTQSNYLQPAKPENILASLTPSAGLCVLFFQPGLLHEGEELRSGIKHILRTEVMFRRDESTKPKRSEQEEEAWALAMQAQAIGDTEPTKACGLYRRAFKLDPKLEHMF